MDGSEGVAAPDQPEAIAERGEHELELGGVTYRLRLSHTATVVIEKKTGRSTLALMRAGNAGELTNDEMAIVAAEYIRAGAADELTKRVGAQRIGELIYEEGQLRVMPRLTLALLDAATGGRTATGEAKAAAA